MSENEKTADSGENRTETEQRLIELTEQQAREIDKLNFENLALWKLAEERGYEHQAKKKIQEEMKALEEYLQTRNRCNMTGCDDRVEYRCGLILRETQGGKGLVMEPHFNVCEKHVKKLNMSYFQKSGDWNYITKALDKNFRPSILFSEVYVKDRFGKPVSKKDL